MKKCSNALLNLPAVSLSVEQMQQAIVDECALLAGDRYGLLAYLMELGGSLPILSAEDRQRAYLIPGCVSQLWFVSYVRGGYLFFKVESDAAVTRGFGALLMRIYSGRFPETILKGRFFLFEALGLGELLSLRRQNGVWQLYHSIRRVAEGYCPSVSDKE